MTQSSCKRDTKSKSHPGMKLAPVRVFSCKHPLSYTFESKHCHNAIGCALILTQCNFLKPKLSLPTPAPHQVVNGHNIFT